MTDDRFRDWDAAYVLGLLQPDDRRAYEEHLSTCASCSDAVAELAGLPGILTTLSTEEAVALLDPAPEPSDDLVTRLAVRAGRRRRRVRLAIAGAGVAAALGLGIGGYALGSADEPREPAGRFVAMSAADPEVMTARLRLEERDWGTRLDWSCDYRGTPGYGGSTTYELVITDLSGRETIAATWVAASPEAASLTTISAVPKDEIKRVEIRVAGSTKPLTETDL
ncbi:zf-HC2 domain-containing protein [Aeromicrobium sp. NPDC092404]|uniref:anti-sigma factor family protein n=1 Tax=Aeromicrobium sp. NPDC092404 TaxID=3154976 RepID=UPI00341BDBDC